MIILLAVLLGIGLCIFTEWNNRKGKELYGHYVDLITAVHEYKLDYDGKLPPSIDALIDEGYYDGVPVNPYSGKQMEFVREQSWYSTDVIVFETRHDDEDGRPEWCRITFRGLYFFNVMGREFSEQDRSGFKYQE